VPVFERASRQLRMMGLNEFPPMEDVDEINEYCSRVSLGSPYFPGSFLISPVF
jgi:hypothetical protein